MALFKSTAFSKLSKSFGNLTVCRSRGQNILKEKVSEVYNPQTIAQQMQRLRMKTLVELCGVYDPVLSLGFPRRPKKFSPDNVFVQHNQQAVTVTEDLEVTIDYKKIVVARGKRGLPEVSVALKTAERQLEFTHVSEEFYRHAADDDLLYAVVLEQSKNSVKVFSLNERKDTEPAVVTLPAAWNVEADNLTVYVFILSKDRNEASDSKCLTLG